MPHPKKKERIMTYYLMTNKSTGWYFCNKSTRPETSVRHHFNRSRNPERKDYNSKFYSDLRAYGEDGFEVEYSIEMPEKVKARAHYLPPEEV